MRSELSRSFLPGWTSRLVATCDQTVCDQQKNTDGDHDDASWQRQVAIRTRFAFRRKPRPAGRT